MNNIEALVAHTEGAELQEIRFDELRQADRQATAQQARVVTNLATGVAAIVGDRATNPLLFQEPPVRPFTGMGQRFVFAGADATMVAVTDDHLGATTTGCTAMTVGS